MAAFTTYDIVGAKEDISDIITSLTPTKTPFQSMIGSESIKNRIHQWQEDALASAAANAQLEGFTAADKTLVATTMRSNNTQILSTTVNVSGSTDAEATYGRAKETAYQLRKASQELKRDLEYALVTSAQTAVVGSNGVARVFAGVQAQINSGMTTAVAGALTEAAFAANNQLLYTAGSEATTFMVKPADAVRVAAWASATGRTRDVGDEQKIVMAINVLITPFGTLRVVINRAMPTANALLMDADYWKLLAFRPWFRETLAKTGDSNRIMIVGEYSLKHLNRDATGLLSTLAA
jgi:hypothetical protein